MVRVRVRVMVSIKVKNMIKIKIVIRVKIKKYGSNLPGMLIFTANLKDALWLMVCVELVLLKKPLLSLFCLYCLPNSGLYSTR